MKYLSFDQESRLLYEYENDEVTFVWTYSVFEKYINEAVTPSMYHFMSGYVFNHSYDEGDDVNANAVNAYFSLPIHTRITMHEQELVNLRSAKRDADAKVSSAIDAMLEENRPFDDNSPISREYNDFMRSLISRYQKQADTFESMIYEEENWFGGHEKGSSDCE
jgi:hypothetical protein